LLMEQGRHDEAMEEIEAAIAFGQTISQGSILIEMYSRKAHLQILAGEMGAAEASLNVAWKVSKEIETVPWQLADLTKGQCEYDLHQLQTAIRTGSKREIDVFRKRARRSARKMRSVAGKVAQNRTESYRYQGLYHWLIDQPEKAFAWWRKAIAEGERLGARLELARTYEEIGKRLASGAAPQGEFDGMSADAYLEKAYALFGEMGAPATAECAARATIN
jgi:tetratricopeptide (TPR) repeat protein